MVGPNERIVRGGQELTARAWALIADVERELGLDLQVVQGGFKDGSGAAASGSTHDHGDVFDIRSRTVPADRRIDVVVALRKRNVCAWYRSPEYGWTSTGPHFHGVLRDSYYPLSSGAVFQVADYDNGFNGLSGSAHARDPFPRPRQTPFQMEDDVALDPADIEKIAKRSAELVWAQVIKTGFQSDGSFDSSNPQEKTAAGLLAASYGKSIQAANRVGAPVDESAIADAVVDEFKDRLQS